MKNTDVFSPRMLCKLHFEGSNLLLWKVHNRINTRLLKEENDSGDSDPSFKKRIWPTKEECTNCFKNKEFNDTEIVNWLKRS